MYCKNYKKNTGNIFPKKVNPDFKVQNQKKIKMCHLFD